MHPKTNICALLRFQVTLWHSPSVSADQLSGSVVNLDPANTWCQPSWQHVGTLAAGHEQCSWRRRYLIPSWLYSVWREVCLLTSNVLIPSLTLLIRMDFDSLNNWSRVSFQQNLFLALTSFLTGCLIGLME